MTIKTKEVLLTLRVNPELRDEFRVVAELEGSTMSGLIHQFIVKSIREQKRNNPEEFDKIRKGLDKVELRLGPMTEAKPKRTNKGGKTNAKTKK